MDININANLLLKLVYNGLVIKIIQMNSDGTTTDNPSWLEKIQKTVRNIFLAVNIFQTPVNQSGTHLTFYYLYFYPDRYNLCLSLWLL